MLYKYWPAKNRFCCRGRFITGPKKDIPSNFIAWLLFLSISAIYFWITSQRIWERIGPLIPICTANLLLLTVVFFMLTQFSDPGIIPRKTLWDIYGQQAPLELLSGKRV